MSKEAKREKEKQGRNMKTNFLLRTAFPVKAPHDLKH